MLNKNLLQIRNTLNRKRPEFVHQRSWSIKALSRKPYRKPKGRHAKMRERRVGKHKIVDAGYRGPAEVRGLSRDGSRVKRITNIKDLEKTDNKEYKIIIASAVSLRKKLLLLKRAEELGLTITNADKNKIDEKIKRLQAAARDRKKKKEKLAASKSKETVSKKGKTAEKAKESVADDKP